MCIDEKIPMMAFIPDCRAAAAAGMELLVARFGRNPGYPFVDTKLSTITGEDFVEAADPATDFRGRSAVFGWIQGRGLEALAGHAAFCEDQPELAAQCDRMLAAVAGDLSQRLCQRVPAARGRDLQDG